MNNRVLSEEEELEYSRLKDIFKKYINQLFVYDQSETVDAEGFPDKIIVCKGSALATYATYRLERDNVKQNVDV